MRGHLLALNAARYPMTNRDFRAAILHSFDPVRLIPAGTDHLRTFRSLILPPLPGSEKPRALKKDVKEARARLKKSGFITGGKFKLRIMTGMAEPHLTIARNLQNEISESLGIPVEVDTLPGQEYTAYRNLGEYHATLITWTAKVLSPQDFLLPYSGEAAYNSMNYRNPFFDQYLFEGVRAKSREAQARSFGEAQKLLCEDEAVASPLYQETATHLHQKGVRGLQFNPMGIPLIDRLRL
jgi:ABC-type oligopeptide transport system substrate-binding subunit